MSLGWGQLAPAAAPSGLSSSLGSAPAAASGGSWGQQAPQAAAVAPPSSGGGGWLGGLLGSVTNPLGLRTSLTQAVSGLGHTFGGAIADFGQGVGSAVMGVGDLATGNTLAAGNQAAAGEQSFQSLGKRVADFGVGAVTSLENAALTVGSPLGPLDNTIIKDPLQGFNKWIGGSALGKSILTPEMATQMYNQGKGLAPVNDLTVALHQGIGAGLVAGIGQVALIAGLGDIGAGVGAGIADRLATSATTAGAVEDAASWAAKAARFKDIQSSLSPFVHPYRTVFGQTAELLGQMRSVALPADVTVPAEGAPATDSPFSPVTTATPDHVAAAQDAVVPHDLLVATRDAMDPTQAATEAMTQATDTRQMALDQLSQLSAPADTTRLYRRGANGDHWSTNPDTVAVGDTVTPDRLQHIDVPNARLAGLPSAPHGDNFTQYDLSAAQDLQSAAVEHAPTTTTVPAPKVGATVEPGKYDVGKPSNYNVHQGRVVAPEEKSVLQTLLRSETAAARAAVHPNLYVVDQLGQRLAMPAPQWAVDVANWMPPSINRLLGGMGANFVDQVRFRNMYRNISQAMETAQGAARTSPAMMAAESAARDILGSKMDRTTASSIIGQEIHARLNGEALLAEWAKAHAVGTDLAVPSEVEKAALENAARGGYSGMTDALWKSLTPEQATALQQHLNEAVVGFRAEAAKAMQTLLATRYGAKGLEASLLDPNEVPMTTEQVRLFRRSERDLRYAAKARERIPTEQARVFADAERATATGARMHNIVDDMRTKLGLTLQTVHDLYKGVPKGLADDGAKIIQDSLAALAQEGGVISDIGKGEILHPTEGLLVHVASQFDIPLSSWAADGPAAIHDAIFNPKAPGGRTYDPQALFGGPDARLSINIANGADGTQHVVGNLSMHTVNGVAMSPWQAYILGGASGTAGAFDFATGSTLPMTLDPNEQLLLQHYIGMTMDAKSGLTRWANQRGTVVADPALNITADQLNKEMIANLWLDHAMADRNPAAWSKGDIFNSELSMGKGAPTLSYLAQLILGGDVRDPRYSTEAANRLSEPQPGAVGRPVRPPSHVMGTVNDLRYGKPGDIVIDPTSQSARLLGLDSVLPQDVLVPEFGSRLQEAATQLSGAAGLPVSIEDVRTLLWAHSEQLLVEQLHGAELAQAGNAHDVLNTLEAAQSAGRTPFVENFDPLAPWADGSKAFARDQTRMSTYVSNGDFAKAHALVDRYVTTKAPTLDDIVHQALTANELYSKFGDTVRGVTLENPNKLGRILMRLYHTADPTTLLHEDMHAFRLHAPGDEIAQLSREYPHLQDATLTAARVADEERFVKDFQSYLRSHSQGLKSEAEVKAAAGDRYVRPITDVTDVQRKQAQATATESIRGGRAISPEAYQALADTGRAYVEDKLQRSAPTVLDTTALRDAAYQSVQEEWGGATVDAHTGHAIPTEYHGDTYAVTARLDGMKEITAPISASRAVFDRAYTRALAQYSRVLESEGGHLGIFRNETTGKIEFDPVYHTQNVQETEAVGAYTHADGGAYNFASGNGHWIPHVTDAGVWKGPSSLKDLYGSVADTMRQHYGPAFMAQRGQALPNSMVDYWDSIFNRDIQRPAQVDDPLSLQYTKADKGATPSPARGESPAAYAQRLRQYGEARGEATVQQQRINDAEARARTADTFANKMHGLIMEPTKSEIVAQKLEDRASRTLTKLATDLQGPEGNQIPRGWRPFMAAVDAIREEAKKDPSLAPLLDEIPANFAKALQFAAERGFEPTYMPEMTWDMAQKYMYGHLQLDTTAGESGMRKQNMGVLSGRATGKQSVVDRSLESLGAGTVMAMKELLQSRTTQFVEENYAREWAPGTPLPDGWKPWEPTRDAIITGRRVEDGQIVSVNSNKIIPDAVYNSLKSFQRPAVDLNSNGGFRFLFKGPAIAVWKHMLLTYSPTWYIQHFMGAVTLATLEGVRLQDWRTAWRQWQTDMLPAETRGRAVQQAIDEIGGGTASTHISRNKFADFPNTVRSEGVKVAVGEFNHKLQNVVQTTNTLARAAVYARTIRKGGSVALAATRSFEALGDFGRLGPIERGLVMQVIPFYAFHKAMLRVLLHMPNDHPVATGMLMQLGAMNQAYLKAQLNGSLPSAYIGADFIGGNGTPGNMGHLTALSRLNPLMSSIGLTTPQGIAAAANPFIRILAQYALNSPAYGAGAGMGPTGQLVPQLNIGQSILGTFTGAVPGISNPGALNLTSGLSNAQYQKLVARITKTQASQATVAAGGYITTDAVKAASKAAVASSGWGSTKAAPKARAATGRSARLSSRIIGSYKVPKVRAPRIGRVAIGFKAPRKSRAKRFGL